MFKEPSLLLIDDWSAHEEHLRHLDLDRLGWKIATAIDPTIEGTTKKAQAEIDANGGGFTLLLLDIIWPRNQYGGVEVLARLKKLYKNLPFRRILIVSRKTSIIDADPILTKLFEKLNVSVDERAFMHETVQGRQRLKQAILGTWRQLKPRPPEGPDVPPTDASNTSTRRPRRG